MVKILLQLEAVYRIYTCMNDLLPGLVHMFLLQ